MMTDEQINIAIAEVCGWENVHPAFMDGSVAGKCPRSGCNIVAPNYCNDLNAMHEAEKALIGSDQDTGLREAIYCNRLFYIINPTKDGAGTSEFDKIHATAHQRAEALLRTLGKWEES